MARHSVVKAILSCWVQLFFFLTDPSWIRQGSDLGCSCYAKCRGFRAAEKRNSVQCGELGCTTPVLSSGRPSFPVCPSYCWLWGSANGFRLMHPLVETEVGKALIWVTAILFLWSALVVPDWIFPLSCSEAKSGWGWKGFSALGSLWTTGTEQGQVWVRLEIMTPGKGPAIRLLKAKKLG